VQDAASVATAAANHKFRQTLRIALSSLFRPSLHLRRFSGALHEGGHPKRLD